MRKNLSTFISKYWPVFGFALLLAGADYYVGHSPRAALFLAHYSDIAFDNPLQIRLKLNSVQRDPAKKLVLVLGSSVARESVEEEIIEQELGGKVQVINLGFFHARPVDLWLLSDELRRLRPDLVLLVLTAADIFRQYNFALTMRYYFSPRIYDLVEVPQLLSHARDYFYSLLGRVSFVFRYRDSVSSALVRWAKDSLGIEPWRNRGKYRFAEQKEFLPPLDSRLSFFGEDFLPDPQELNSRALRKLVESFRQDGAKLLMIPALNHPRLDKELHRVKREDVLNWRDGRLPPELGDLAQNHGVTVLYPEKARFPGALYADYVHLNTAGRRVFSLWLANWLRQTEPFATELR